MDSEKKRTPHSWAEIVSESRSESPPAIDVRAYVRSQLEVELRSPVGSLKVEKMGLLDGVLELFAEPVSRISLGAGLGAAALLAIVSSFNVEVRDLTGDEMEVVENFEEAMVGEDWSQYL
ncbi:MAG: hypothetical protein MKZ70_00900 [Opitutales bacterium]|nr:hypothetical protein [Opitutales bacterium]MCH2613240.1 hypothetical protein [Opitutales bacterium]|tara:strand:- start:496 stop:855 length:360 start_codon:yes stop_codon:yes gene_type:complete